MVPFAYTPPLVCNRQSGSSSKNIYNPNPKSQLSDNIWGLEEKILLPFALHGQSTSEKQPDMAVGTSDVSVDGCVQSRYV
jgi:hypothetical protein